jgi:tetratricopeptide (TPR) repeat protein
MISLAQYVLLFAIVCISLAMGPTLALSHTPEGRLQAPDRITLRDQLFTAQKNARTEGEAQQIENEIWQFWSQGPDPEATKQISEVFAARRAYDLEKALRIATELTERLPDYAEGWNQRATVLFMQEKPDASLEAIERVLELEPKHFGALAGKAVILIRQGRMAIAQATLRRAVESHPFLRERHLILEPKGVPI